MAIPSSWASAGVRLSTGPPSKTIDPSSGAVVPEATFINVDLPAPFSPSRAWTSPGRTSNETSLSATTASKCLVIPTMDNVGCRALLLFSAITVTATLLLLVSVSCARRSPCSAARNVCDFDLLLHQLRLGDCRQLGGEVDVARKVGLALHRMRLPGRRVLEHERRKVGARRLLAAGCERHGPVDREARVVVLRGDGEELEGGVLGHVLLPEAPEHVAVG